MQTNYLHTDSVSHYQVQMFSITVLLLACNLQMIVSFESYGTNA